MQLEMSLRMVLQTCHKSGLYDAFECCTRYFL